MAFRSLCTSTDTRFTGNWCSINAGASSRESAMMPSGLVCWFMDIASRERLATLQRDSAQRVELHPGPSRCRLFLVALVFAGRQPAASHQDAQIEGVLVCPETERAPEGIAPSETNLVGQAGR